MQQKKLILLTFFIMLGYVSFSQDDSVRTRNDKPGTPSSLRTPDNSPQNGDPLINRQRAPVGTINHGGMENSKTTNTNQQTHVNGSVNQANDNQNLNNTPPSNNVKNNADLQNGTNNLHKSTPSDSVIINGAYYQKPSNVTNPIKHD